MATQSIGIDIREANTQNAGKSTYCKELTRALIQNAPHKLRFVLFTKDPNPDFPSSDRVEQVSIKGKSFFWHLNLRRYLKHHPVDTFLAPTSYLYPALAPKTQKIALVVHDLIAFLHPQNHPLFPTWVERLSLPRALKKANLLITVSKHTHKDLIQMFPASQRKHHVVAYPGVSSVFQPTPSNKLRLPKRYLLALGTLQPRKNLITVFRAFEHLAEQDPELHLVIAGGKGWKTTPIYAALPKAHKERIHFLGYVPFHALPELYSRAEMLLFPSLYEGFGLPPLEAMACGTPVITSKVSSLPEVVGNAAITLAPTDTQALMRAIAELLNPQVQEVYRKKGLQRAREFTWEKAARSILQALSI